MKEMLLMAMAGGGVVVVVFDFIIYWTNLVESTQQKYLQNENKTNIILKLPWQLKKEGD